jgi:hypothetical protein
MTLKRAASSSVGRRMERVKHDSDDIGGEANEATPADHHPKKPQLNVALTYGNAGVQGLSVPSRQVSADQR